VDVQKDVFSPTFAEDERMQDRGFVLSLFLLLAAVFFNAAPVFAASPVALTTNASGISRIDATLNGQVNPGNEITTVYFEYSTSPLDSLETPPQTIAASPSPVTGSSYAPVSADLTSLSPWTTYRFRLVAENSSGVGYGVEFSFSTDPVAQAVTEIAGPVTESEAGLRGTVNPLGESSEIVFEYGLTTAYGSTIAADQSPLDGSSDTTVTANLSGLVPNTVYHYRISVTNTYGTVYGDDMTFFTSAQATPLAYTEEPTFSSLFNSATLHGIVRANNSDSTVVFEYGTTTSYGNMAAADQSPVRGTADTAVSRLITGLTPNTTYHYRVAATNSLGTSYGSDITFYNTSSPYAKTEPASLLGNTVATLNGTVNPKTSDFGAETSVIFEYGLTDSYGTTVTALQSPFTGGSGIAVNAYLTGLLPGTTYHYRVIAENVNGTGTGADMTFTTTLLPSAETLGAAPVGNTSATLNGHVNPQGEATTITFEYGLTSSYGTTVPAIQSPSSAASDSGFSRSVSGLLTNTTYHYRIVATNSYGTVYGQDRTFTTGMPPPTAATNTATSISATTAVLNGTVNANGLATSVSFEWGTTTPFQRSENATPSSVSGSVATGVSLSLTNLSPGTVYFYRTVATSDGGTVYGAEMSFTTTSLPAVETLPASSVDITSATLNGNVNANGFPSTVTFEYGITTAYGTTVTAAQSPVSGSSTTGVNAPITGLAPSTTYHYRVVGQSSQGVSYGEDRTFSTVVGAPVVTTGNASPLFTGAIVEGTVNASNASTTVIFEYGTTVAYGSSVTAEQSPVDGSADTAVSASLSGLGFNQTYHYRVVATNVNGTTYGADRTFLTSLNPSAITLAAQDISGTTATLKGTANGNSGSWSVRFDYGATVAYGASITATPDRVSGSENTPIEAVLTALAPSTTYHYRAVIYSGGLNYYGGDQTFTTAAGPSLTTDAATAVGALTATLNATVIANDIPAIVSFEYGPDTNYGKTAAASPSPVNGTVPTSVSSLLTALEPSTTYHYRAVADSSAGTVYGTDMEFSTSALAPSATTDAASVIRIDSAVLNGTVDPQNDSTTVMFEYGLSTGYGTTVAALQSPIGGPLPHLVSAGISGLQSHTLYNYRVVAQNSMGTTYGGNVTFFTSGASPDATTTAATMVSRTGAVLNGLVNGNGNITTVTFEIGTDTAYGRTIEATPSPLAGAGDTAVSADLAGLLIPDTIYHFRVIGSNAAGTAYGENMTFYTGIKEFPWQVLLPGLVLPKTNETGSE
jgi:phosphodiesterase/alkaline phosphatase D-like protein